MAQAVVTTNSTFVKGLNTEASIANFPEGYSVDEDNMELLRSGKRRVRKGLEFDSSGSLSSWTLQKGKPTAEFTWENVANQIGLEFLVLQVGATVRFYDKSYSPVSGGEKSFTIDLNAYSVGNGYVPSDERIDAANVGSRLIICSPAIDSIIVEYDPDTDSIDVTIHAPKVRDFEWQGDKETYFEGKVSPDAARRYDTFNVGWVSTNERGEGVLNEWQAAEGGAWPPLNFNWGAGKDATQDEEFDVKLVQRGNWGNTIVSNGHFKLDLFNKQRASAYNNQPRNSETTITTAELPDEIETQRFTTVVGYAGRAFFSGIASTKNGSKVFYTRVIRDLSDINDFYQLNDPTADELSDLLDNDGGVIDIPQAAKIRKLFEWGNSLLVFAENGVWEIKGVDGVFKASEFAVSRVRGVEGLQYPATLVSVEGVPVWWGRTGIFTIEGDQVTSAPSGTDIAKGTIQTFWDSIGASFRQQAKGVYDATNKKILWLYGTDATIDYKYNRILILDTVLQAFYPYTISDESSNTNYIVGAQFFTGFGAQDETFDVWSNSDTDDVLTNASADDVVQDITQQVTNDEAMVFILRDGSTGTIGFGGFTSDTYLDWTTENYTAYAEAAYIVDQTITTKKKNLFVTTMFDRTEDGFSGSGGSYTPTNQSKCTLKVYWDNNSNTSSSKEIYRLRRPVLVDEGDLTSFNYPYDTVVTRNKIRGRGRWCKLRFENTPGKQFSLVAYEVMNARNESP